MEKKTQTGEILKHLKKYGSITSWEAISYYGATRLSAIIYMLRNFGHNIETDSISITNRYGNSSTIAKYIYKKGENE